MEWAAKPQYLTELEYITGKVKRRRGMAMNLS
jgi:hypothetical protein